MIKRQNMLWMNECVPYIQSPQKILVIKWKEKKWEEGYKVNDAMDNEVQNELNATYVWLPHFG